MKLGTQQSESLAARHATSSLGAKQKEQIHA